MHLSTRPEGLSGSGDRAPEERTLVEGLLARRPEAVSEFLERTHHPVYLMSCRLAKDPSIRRDWAHTVLLGILEDLDRGKFVYRGPGSFWAWFKKRAYFRLLDCYRGERQIQDRESPEGSTDDLPEFAPEGVLPDEELERTRLRSALESCLQRLENRDHQKALFLLLLEDQSYESVAQQLQAPLNTVRAWIRRGRLQLRLCLTRSLGISLPGDAERNFEAPLGGS